MTDAETLAELRRINARFIHNFVTGDVASHDALLHPDFICISSSGRYLERAPYLERWATLFDAAVIPYWDTRDEKISVFRDVALVRASNKFTERSGSTEVTGMTAYTDTYIRERGRWRCVQAQLTDVQPPFWPGDSTIISVYENGVRVR